MSYEYTVHEEDYRGHKIRLVPDDTPESPREWDCFGTMTCKHRRYNLGDTQDDPPWIDECGVPAEVEQKWLDDGGWESTDDIPEEKLDELVTEWRVENFIIKSLFLYDHSGLTMSTVPFSCPWDSGQVGWVWCTVEEARKEFGDIPIEELRQKASRLMTAEVETYSAYLENRVVGYVVEDENEDMVDSCWGFYPDADGGYEYTISQAKAVIDSHIEETPPDGDWHENLEPATNANI